MEHIRLEEDSSNVRQCYKCCPNEKATSEMEAAVPT